MNRFTREFVFYSSITRVSDVLRHLQEVNNLYRESRGHIYFTVFPFFSPWTNENHTHTHTHTHTHIYIYI